MILEIPFYGTNLFLKFLVHVPKSAAIRSYQIYLSNFTSNSIDFSHVCLGQPLFVLPGGRRSDLWLRLGGDRLHLLAGRAGRDAGGSCSARV